MKRIWKVTTEKQDQTSGIPEGKEQEKARNKKLKKSKAGKEK